MARYGYGVAVALEEIDHLESYGGQSECIGTGSAILLVGLGLITALGVVYGIQCAGDDFC